MDHYRLDHAGLQKTLWRRIAFDLLEGESGWPTILGLWRLPLMEEVTFGVKDLNASCRIDDIQSILLINRDYAWLEKASWLKPRRPHTFCGRSGFDSERHPQEAKAAVTPAVDFPLSSLAVARNLFFPIADFARCRFEAQDSKKSLRGWVD